MSHDKKILVVGAGNIGTAMARGILRSGRPVTIYNRSERRLEQFSDDPNATVTTNLGATVRTEQPAVIVICVEGEAVEPVISEMGPEFGQSRPVLVSCAAASSLDMLSEAVSVFEQEPKVVRVLPTIAAAYGCSTNLVCARGVDRGALDELKEIFAATGDWVEIPETKFGAAMSLTSCGIAFALRYIRAASQAGVELGLAPEAAAGMAASALEGAAAMLRATGQHPEALVDRVTTPGGLTIKGLNTMEAHGFSAALMAGVKAAVKQ